MRLMSWARGGAVPALVALALVSGAGGCKKDTAGPGAAGDDGDYYGIFSATDGLSAFGGALVITIQAGAASGTLTPSGLAGVGLTGTFNTSTKAVSLAGGGHTLTGTIVSGVLNGSYSGPGGTGSFATQHGSSSEVQQFCGFFDGDATGTWNLSRRGNTLAGAYASDDGDSGALQGTISNGSAINISFTGGSASGQLTSATHMIGSWTAGGGLGGWQGDSPCQ